METGNWQLGTGRRLVATGDSNRPPGQLVSVGTHHLYISCQGTGAPAVVFDAALGASSVSWSLVQPTVARLTRACTYDRAGMGWSNGGPLPRTAGRMSAELHTLLQTAAVPPPYVLVGHSFGGFVMRIFAATYPVETAGLVLVDPAHPEHWLTPSERERHEIDRGVRLCGYGVIAARLGLARLVAALVGVGALAPARALVKAISRGRLRREDEFVLAPIWKLPPDARRPLRRFWTQPKFFEALGSQIGSVCESAREVQETVGGGYGDLPLVTISSSNPDPVRARRQEDLARLSSRGRHIVASDSGHWIPLDQPQIVIDTIADMIRSIGCGRASGFIPGV
ncbi:MAG TPA: alpha/beta hydrolase [Vicinamibacterales bacterium]|nr:alpha/beta hydrolase [Vicinamibacterales bacterium]